MTVKCILWSYKMISVFILPLNHFRNWDAQREELTNAQREKDRAVDRDLAFTPIAILRSTVPIAISRSTAPIAISQSTAPIAISPSCRSQPLVEPSRLSLFLLLSIWPDLMIFFSGFCLCFCIEEWMILYINLATKKMWENVSNK